jgi:hypothetical protein
MSKVKEQALEEILTKISFFLLMFLFLDGVVAVGYPCDLCAVDLCQSLLPDCSGGRISRWTYPNLV